MKEDMTARFLTQNDYGPQQIKKSSTALGNSAHDMLWPRLYIMPIKTYLIVT